MTAATPVDVTCGLTDAQLTKRLGAQAGDILARERVRVADLHRLARVKASEANQPGWLAALDRYLGLCQRALYNATPAGQLRAILDLDARVADVLSGAWGRRVDAMRNADAARQAAIRQAAAPALLLARLKAAGTPLALDGDSLTIPPGTALYEHVIREVVEHKAALVALLRSTAVAEPPRPVVVA